MSTERDEAWEYERPEYGSVEAEAGSAAFPTPRASDAQSSEAAEALPAQRVDADGTEAVSAESADVSAADAAEGTVAADGEALVDADAAVTDSVTDSAPDAAADPDADASQDIDATAAVVEPATPAFPEPADDATWQLSTDMAPLPPLRQCLEAILLVVEEPVAEVVLAQITERPRDEVAAVLQELSREYTEQQRGFDLRQVAGGWRFYTRASCAPLVEKFVLDGQQARLSTPALETLAVVAYRQPVSRSRISAVRGVNCDGVMRTLLTRGLVEEAGADAESGAILYRTTTYFLERMGMQSLDELPELAPLLPSIESMEEAESVS
jgi:segregation and condensation protein B